MHLTLRIFALGSWPLSGGWGQTDGPRRRRARPTPHSILSACLPPLCSQILELLFLLYSFPPKFAQATLGGVSKAACRSLDCARVHVRAHSTGAPGGSPSPVSDIVRPQLLLEVKAANKVGHAIQRTLSGEGWRPSGQLAVTGRGCLWQVPSGWLGEHFCNQGDKYNNKAWLSSVSSGSASCVR